MDSMDEIARSVAIGGWAPATYSENSVVVKLAKYSAPPRAGGAGRKAGGGLAPVCRISRFMRQKMLSVGLDGQLHGRITAWFSVA